VQDIDADYTVLAGQGVDGHLGNRRAIGEIEERPTLGPRPIPVDFRGRVEARGRERHARPIGIADKVFEGYLLRSNTNLAGEELDLVLSCLPAFGSKPGQTGLDFTTRIVGRHAVEVGAR